MSLALADVQPTENPKITEITVLEEFEGMTNGDVIISLYPDLKYTIQNGRVVTTIGVASSFDLDWWNAPYKAESEVKPDEVS